MTSKFVFVALLGAGTVAAAAAGGYFALRRNALDRPAAVSDVPVGTSAAVVELPQPDAAPIKSESVTSSRTPRPSRVQPAPRPSAAQPVVTATASDPAAPPIAPSAPAVPQGPSSEPAGEPKDTRAESAPAPVYEPARPRTEELVVAPDSVIGIRLESAVSSENARVEDTVTARVSRDVTVDGKTAIASGTRLDGVVASVEKGGKFKDRARIGIRFQSLVLADGTRLPIETETIFRESESPTGSAASKVGASAAVGGILGAVIGGKKGAAIGSTVGAAGGSAAVMAGNPATAVLPAGTPLTVRLTEPVTVRIQREDE